MQFEDIPQGKHDDELKQAAEGAIQYGEKYGGFFLSPMWEMNLESHWVWRGNSRQFKRVWSHIWQIFEDKGANRFAHGQSNIVPITT